MLHFVIFWVNAKLNKQFRLCLVDILGLCNRHQPSKLLLGTVNHRRSDSVLYLWLSCVYCTTCGSTPEARTHLPDFSLITFKFPDFSMFSRLVATLSSSRCTKLLKPTDRLRQTVAARFGRRTTKTAPPHAPRERASHKAAELSNRTHEMFNA